MIDGSQKKARRSLVLLMIFYVVVLLFNLGGWGVIETSEARYAEISREMFESGDWLHPTLLGIRHYHKPPFTYWITEFGYEVFGVNPFGARFFLVVSLLIQLRLVYVIARRIFEDKAEALVAAIAYGSMPMVLVSIRGLTTDSYLATCILGAIASWFQWKHSGKAIWLYLVAVSLGIGFLTKGPVALLVPVLVGIGVRTFSQVRRKFSVHHLLALLLFFVISLSWFVMLVMEDQSVIDYFVLHQTVDRYANAGVFRRDEPWWYYLVYGPLLALPWTFVFLFKRQPIEETGRKITARQLAIFWVIVPFIFFSLSSSKLVLYILPLYSGLALVVTQWLRRLSPAQIARLEKIWLVYVIVLAAGLLAFFNIYKAIVIPIWMRYTPLLFLILLVVMRKSLHAPPKTMQLVYSLFILGLLVLTSSFLFMYNELTVNSTEPITEWLQTNNMTKRNILVYNTLLPSISFHLRKQIISLHDGNPVLDREVQFEHDAHWKNLFFDIRDPEEVRRLKSLLDTPSVLIVKGELKPSGEWLQEAFPKRQEFGKWKVYYN